MIKAIQGWFLPLDFKGAAVTTITQSTAGETHQKWIRWSVYLLLAWTQLQWGLSALLTGDRTNYFDEFLLLVSLVVIGPAQALRSLIALSDEAKIFIAAWFGLGVLSAAVHQSFGIWTALTLAYLVKAMPIAFAYWSLEEPKRDRFRNHILYIVLATQTLSALFCVGQGLIRMLFHPSFNLDYVTGLHEDANLAGAAIGLAIVAIYDLSLRIEQLPRWLGRQLQGVRRTLWVAAYVIALSFTFSQLVSLAFLIGISVLELMCARDGKRKAIQRGVVLLAFQFLVYFAQDYVSMGGLTKLEGWQKFKLDFLPSLQSHLTDGFVSNHVWRVQGEFSTREEDGGRIIRLVAGIQFWWESARSHLFGLGPGAVNFPALRRHAHSPYMMELQNFVFQKYQMKSLEFMTQEFTTWLMEWGPIALLVFLGTSVVALVRAFKNRWILECAVLAFGIFQTVVHEWMFGFLMGPLTFLALARTALPRRRAGRAQA